MTDRTTKPGFVPVEDRRTQDDHGHDVIDPFYAAIVTVSTSRSREAASGPVDDPGGDAAEGILRERGHDVTVRELVPDDYARIRTTVQRAIDRPDVDAVLTTGGTGVTADDVTVEAVSGVFEKTLPGFGELFRRFSYDEVGTRAVATRAVAGIARGAPVFVLPGSANAVRLATEAIIVEETPHLAGLATSHRNDGADGGAEKAHD
ncbi:MogA/MoaB family molybdenum cofactor biosynthesis protein [Halegenticoccus tardaugens]|uniref:MogA/MoaB family molybdenum cofactor biosynthesis protein n=1 Tax=Halegenticoccus tardaugens TaxID=2071624 RepID=UPI00100B3FCD|nr:MogA/MoaB family molybdenum cofactor biosynthesis protein [Halegenticoccus tardaugens]